MWDLIGKATVGLLLARLGYSFLKGLYGSFIGAALGLNLDVKTAGKWAVVTGATDGIGKAYAFELARRGMSIVLISRTPFKLQNVAADIHTKYGTETKTIDVDFTQTNIYDRLKEELKDLDIGVLVNNVGISYEYPEYFTQIKDGDNVCSSLITCNVISVTNMTRLVLPGMEERKRGVIINVSSLSSTVPAPFLSVYGATKAYVESLSQNLAAEYASKGVTIQCVLPAFVVTNMSKIKRPSLMIPTPTAYVRSSLNTIGIETRTAGYYMHKLQLYFIEIASQYLPGCILTSVVYNQLYSMRARNLKKQLKEAKSE